MAPKLDINTKQQVLAPGNMEQDLQKEILAIDMAGRNLVIKVAGYGKIKEPPTGVPLSPNIQNQVALTFTSKAKSKELSDAERKGVR